MSQIQRGADGQSAQNSTISADTRAQLNYDAQKKSMLVSYLLWIFLGWFGAHRFYLGRIVSGLILLALTILTFLIGMVTLGFGSFLMAIPAIWVLVDAFLIPGIVRRANQALIARL